MAVRSYSGTDHKSNRQRKFAPKAKTGCSRCKASHVRCGEEKPSCKRCVRLGYTCDDYGTRSPKPDAQRTAMALALGNGPSMPRQLQLDVSPAQVNATQQDFEMFYFFRKNVARYFTEDYNQSLWTVHLFRAAQHSPCIWHACTALAAAHMRKQQGVLALAHGNKGHNNHAAESMASLYLMALRHRGIVLKHIIAMMQRRSKLSYADKCTILATGMLLGFCSWRLDESFGWIKNTENAFRLIHEWALWKPPPTAARNMSSSLSEYASPIPSSTILLFYVQQDHSFKLNGASQPQWAWQWEDAVVLRQQHHFVTLSDAWLEFDMIFVAADNVFERAPQELSRIRIKIQHYLRIWRARFDIFKQSLAYHTEPSHETLSHSLELRQILLGVQLRVDTTKLQLSWDVFRPQFSRALSLVETHLLRDDQLVISDDSSSFSPRMSSCLHFIATKCRQPSMRRRAARLMIKQRRKDGREEPGFWTASIQAVIHIEEVAWRSADEQDTRSGCTCVAGRFVCNMHRVSDYTVEESHSEPGKLVFRTVGDVLHNRPPTIVPLWKSFSISLEGSGHGG